MIPVLLRIGPLTIYSYGMMMALGFIAGDFILTRECHRRGFSPDLPNAAIVWGAIGGIAGSRIYDVIENWPVYMENPWTIVFSGSGFVWYGGLLGGIFAIWLVGRRYGVGFVTLTDMCAPALVFGQALGRIGCLLSGDGDWGTPSTLPWAMAYPRAIVGWNANTVLKVDSNGMLVSGYFPGVRVHPAPIYEAILYLATFAVLWSLRKKAPAGRMLALYLVLAGAARFVVEFVRINPRVLWGLSMAQVISVLMIVVGAAILSWPAARKTDVSRPLAARA